MKSLKKTLNGRAWVFGDNVDTDQIIPAEFLVTSDSKELAAHAFGKARPEFARGVRSGDAIVGGDNFGCGSSREHAVRALLGAGVSCIVAKSFARIFYRNSVDLCLPAVECGLEAKDGDNIEVDLAGGKILNASTGRRFSFKPFTPFAMSLMEKGGLMAYVKEELPRTR